MLVTGGAKHDEAATAEAALVGRAWREVAEDGDDRCLMRLCDALPMVSIVVGSVFAV